MPPKAFGGPKIFGGSIPCILPRQSHGGSIYLYICVTGQTDLTEKLIDNVKMYYNCVKTMFLVYFPVFVLSMFSNFDEVMVVMSWEFDTDQLQVCRIHLLTFGIWDHIFSVYIF